MLATLLKDLKQNAEVLDYGCFGWSLHAQGTALGRNDLKHSGSDIQRPEKIPAGVAFYESTEVDNSIGCDSDKFDLVVASHVFEHILKPIPLFAELARVCKPGGKIYIESPSDRSLYPLSSPDVCGHAFLNFWDDPTHVRPWTPAAFYRLAISFGYMPVKCAYMTAPFAKIFYRFRRLYALLKRDGDMLTDITWEAYNWRCYVVIEKPVDVMGKPEYRFISLKGISRGTENALKLYRDLIGH
ncbi:MAG: methyltransferase domain-containing protein [Pseudomonadota bacterium]